MKTKNLVLFLYELYHRGVYLGLDEDGKLKYKLYKKLDNKELWIDRIKKVKKDISILLKNYHFNPCHHYDKYFIYPLNVETAPLSYSQQSLWSIDSMYGASEAYNVPFVFELKKDVTCECLEIAFRTVINNHECLRTVIDENGPVQVINNEDFTLRKTEVKLEELDEKISEELNRPFSLASDYPMRARCFSSEGLYILTITFHHIAFDGWSIELFFNELQTAYHQHTSVLQRIDSPKSQVQYKDYSYWQHHFLSGDRLNSLVDYWKGCLSGYETLSLKTDYPRQKSDICSGDTVEFQISQTVTKLLQAQASQLDISFFSLLLGSYYLLLTTYSGQTDVVVGTPFANRQSSQVEDSIGFFVNALALRIQINPLDSLKAFFTNVQTVVLEAQEHGDLPFEVVVDKIESSRKIGRHPIFQTLFTLEESGDFLYQNELFSPFKRVQDYFQVARFDISTFFTLIHGKLEGGINFSTSVFDRSTICNYVETFMRILEELSEASGNLRVGELPSFASKENMCFLRAINNTYRSYTERGTLVGAFKDQVMNSPEKVAVVHEQRQFTYYELDKLSNQLARHLRTKMGVTPGNRVGILLHPGEWILVSILGILKAGAAYVPLDPEAPRKRLEYMVANAGLEVIISDGDFSSQVKLLRGLKWVSLKTTTIHQHSSAPLEISTPLKSLAYVIYTSGSTGMPKGVMISHESAFNRIMWMDKEFPLSTEDVILQKTPYTFDVSVWELFWGIIKGGSVVFADSKLRKDPQNLMKLISKQLITHLHFVPSMLYVFLESMQSKMVGSLKRVFSSGEYLHFELIYSFYKDLSQTALINLYGPTETTVDSTFFRCVSDGITRIGQPIDNTEIFVCDEALRVVPIGAIGELCISGRGLARGYIDNPALTATSFIAHPFRRGERLYKTGDLVRWDEEGNLEYIGRKDHQVKLRGFRIELGEIESQLRRVDGVSSAAVELWSEGKNRQEYLIGYYTGIVELSKDQLESQLKETLPEYMIPHQFHYLKEFKRTSSGKLDRKALPGPNMKASEIQTAPRDPIEEQMSKIWQQVLGLEFIGVFDSFFQLGGSSIQAILLVNEVKKYFALNINIAILFKNNTIEKLSGWIKSQKNCQSVISNHAVQEKNKSLSFSQERMWFIDQYEGGTNAYNIPYAFRLKSEVDLDCLRKALNSIVQRHETLSSIVVEEGNRRFQQKVDKELTVYLKKCDEEKIDGVLIQDAQALFNLTKELPIRCFVYTTEAYRYLSITFHHIAFDGWSEKVFFNDFSVFYDYYSGHSQHLTLPDLSWQYMDFSAWQRQYLSGERLSKLLKFWKDHLEGYQTLNISTDKSRPKDVSYEGDVYFFEIKKQLGQRLTALASEIDVSLFSLLLGSFYLLIRSISGQCDLVIGTPVVNRHYPGVANLVGSFVNTLALRVRIDCFQSLKDYFRKISKIVIAAQLNQDLPFEKLLEELEVQKDGSRHPLFQVTFEFSDFQNGSDEDELLRKYEPKGLLYQSSKFDFSSFVERSGECLKGGFSYAKALFDRDTIQQYARTFQHLLHQISTIQLSSKISGLAYITDSEKDKILNSWSVSADYALTQKSIHQLFENQSKNKPDAIALACGKLHITYKQLNEKANQLATYLLQKYQIQFGECIALFFSRSENPFIAILAILKLGACFVPIPVSFPKARVNHILSQTSARIVLCDYKSRKLLDNHGIRKQFIVSIEAKNHHPVQPLKIVGNKKLAYIIYTSGSTGSPKGVAISHGAVVNYVSNLDKKGLITDKSTVDFSTQMGFDLSITTMIGSICIGAKVEIFDVELEDFQTYRNHIISRMVSVVKQVPSYFPFLKKIMVSSHLRTIILGGEKFDRSQLRDLPSLDIEIFDEYGPTETTVGACLSKIYPEIDESIGKPYGNYQAYVLNKELALLPPKSVGELFIGGEGLARGYFSKPDLTAERFIPNPFRKGERLYRTGDLAKWRSDAKLIFIGREDNQVKFKGYRIELEEIESQLHSVPGILEAIVAVKQHPHTDQDLLVAYYVSSREIDHDFISEQLASKLPNYMLPNSFHRLEKVLLTDNGKLDRVNLPNPLFPRKESYVSPQDFNEKVIAAVWKEVLGVDRVGVTDDFFRLGGDSITSIQLVSKISQFLKSRVNVKDIFECRTVRNLCHTLKARGKREIKIQTEQGILTGEVDLLPVQEWFFDQNFEVPSHWNQSFLIRVPELDIPKLKSALQKLYLHHDCFRLRYRGRKQFYTALDGNCELKKGRFSDELDQLLSDWQSHFDLEKGPLHTFGYISGYEDGSARIFISAHHLLIDLVSWRILVEHLRTLYEGEELGLKGSSYRQWVKGIKEYPIGEQEKEYWDGIELKHLDLPIANKVSRVEFKLDKVTTKKLVTEVHDLYRTEINDILLAALGLSIREVFGADEISITLESHGRESFDPTLDVSQTVGWFTSFYPVNLMCRGGIGEVVRETKEAIRSIPNKGIGYGPICRYKELPQVVFNYLGKIDGEALEEWSITSEEGGATVAAKNESQLPLVFEGKIVRGNMMFWVEGRCENTKIQQIAREYKSQLNNIISYASIQTRSYLTVSDVQNIVSRSYLDTLQKGSEIEGVFIANSLQEGFIHHYLKQGDIDDAYRVQLVWDYNTQIKVTQLRHAWEHALDTFSTFRLRFSWSKELVQVIDKKKELDWRFLDFTKKTVDPDQTIKEVLDIDRKEGFDLARGRLWRIYLIKHHETLYSSILSHHHIILDGWSGPILLNFVHEAYVSLSKGEMLNHSLEDSYPKLQKYVQNHSKDYDEYWKSTLSKVNEKCEIRLLKRNANKKLFDQKQSSKPYSIEFSVLGEFYYDLDNFCQNSGVTINAAIQLAWHKILNIYGGGSVTVSGITVSGRDLAIDGALNAVGLCINTLPLVFEHRLGEEVLSAVRRIQDTIQEVSFRSTTHLSSLQTGSERLFDSIVVFENYPAREGNTSLHIQQRNAVEKVDYPISLIAFERANQLVIRLTYDKDVVDSREIQQVLGLLKTILAQLISSKTRWGEIGKLEDERVLKEWNSTTVNYPKDVSLPELFEEQMQLTPDSIAMVFKDKHLCYKAFHDKIRRLCHLLISKYKISAGDCIAVCLERSEQMMIVILAILRAGAAYVPIDTHLPMERKKYIVDDVDAQLIILSDKELNEFSHLTVPTLNLEGIDLSRVTPMQAMINLSSSNPAYVIYTSGTTGYPKGVMVSHQSVINRIFWMHRVFPLGSGGKLLQKTPYSFDVSVWELFWAFITGGTLVIADSELHKDPIGMGNLVLREGIEKIHFVPSMLGSFLDVMKRERFPLLKNIFCSGERLQQEQIESMGRDFPEIVLANLYGPTETTVDSTFSIMRQGVKTNIGKPIDNTQVYVLDHSLNPVPIGVIGELFIAGDGLALGYIGKAELTAEKFVANPFGNGSRMYKTGDLVRWDDFGHLDYIGRTDNQVKIRGLRVELGEIEDHLKKINGVKKAVVLLKTHGRTKEKSLAAYLISDGDIEVCRIKALLALSLPEHMVPDTFVVMEDFPLQLSGKLDHSKLPEPSFDLEEEYEEPISEMERLIASVWSSILDIPTISREANFFGLGGNSLLAIRCISILREKYGLEAMLRGLYENPKLRDFAIKSCLPISEEEGGDIIRTISRSKQVPLSLSQKRFWFLEKFIKGSTLYHISICIRIKGELSKDALKKAFNYLSCRHEILRTRIVEVEGSAFQEVSSPGNPYPYHESTSGSVHETQTILKKFLARSFNFEQENLSRAILIEEPEHNYVLGIVFHHAIVDEWSLKIFSRELETCYLAFSKGEQPPLTPLPFQYRDFTEWQRFQFSKNQMGRDLEFWKSSLQGFTGHQLPLDYPRPNEQSFRGETIQHFIEKELLEDLEKLAKENHVTLFVVFLSLFFWTLSKLSNQQDIVIGTPVSHRNSRDLEKVIGLFVNTLILRSKLSGKDTFREYLKSIQQIVLEAVTHQNLPFEMLVDAMEVERDLSRNPLFQIMFSVEDGDEIFPKFQNTSITPMPLIGSKLTKFDLTFVLNPIKDGAYLTIDFSKDLFEVGSIEEFIGVYCHFAREVVERPEVRFGEIEFRNNEYRNRLFQDNLKSDLLDCSRSIHHIIQDITYSQPDAIALLFDGKQVTYELLMRKAKAVSSKLLQIDIGPEKICILSIPKSFEMVVGILGVTGAGGAYLPLDIDAPPERRNFILNTSGASVVLTTKKDSHIFNEFSGELLIIDEPLSSGESRDLEPIHSHPEALAYCVYTSGTTGNPKGVECHYKGIMHTIDAVNKRFEIGRSDTGIALASLSFDLSAYDIFGLLSAGGKVVIPAQENERSFDYLAKITRSYQVTIWNSVPQLANLLLDEFQWGASSASLASMRLFLLSGDKISSSLPIALRSTFQGAEVVSLGGSTEGSIWSIWHLVEFSCKDTKLIPYGKALPNQQMWILDEHLNLCGVGVIGEILIGGVGVVRGYASDPSRTATSFIASPFDSGKRLYRTGDIGRYLPDGNIEILGRKDFQVKVRGYRVELEEIESVMLEIDSVERSAVVFDGKHLIGYVVSSSSSTESIHDELEQVFRKKLPSYMHPEHIMLLREVPLTSNGKIDRAALPRPSMELSTSDFQEPVGTLEERLATVWEELLNIKNVGRSDDFFRLGGDSIIAIQMVSRAKHIGLSFDIKQVFSTPTVRGLVAHADRIDSTEKQLNRNVSGVAPLLPIQKLFIEDEVDLNYFNQASWFTCDGSVDFVKLEEAINVVRQCHESFNLRYSKTSGSWVQEYSSFKAIEISVLKEGLLSGEFNEHVEKLQKSIDIENGPLDIALWVPDKGLLWIIHHFIIDGVSWRILIEDLNRVYHQKPLPSASNSYKDWGEYLSRYQPDKEDLDYYIKQFTEVLPLKNRSSSAIPSGGVTLTLSRSQTSKFMKDIHHGFATTPQEILLFSLLLTLCDESESSSFTVALESHGRDALQSGLDLSRTVGWFTALYPASFEVLDSNDWAKAIEELKEQFRKIPKKGASYGPLYNQRRLEPIKADLIFNYLGNFDLGSDSHKTFQFGAFPTGKLVSENRKQLFPLEINSLIMDGKLTIKWIYSSALTHNYVSGLSCAFEKKLISLIEFLSKYNQRRYTPSDFEAKDITQDDIDEIMTLIGD